MFFSGIKNLNWKVLTDNSVTFNGWGEAKNEKF